MTKTAFTLIVLATITLAACDDGTGVPPGTAGRPPADAAQAACRASTSISSLMAVTEIVVTQVTQIETGYSINLTVSHERDPYTCVTDALGNVQSVTFTGPGIPQAN